MPAPATPAPATPAPAVSRRPRRRSRAFARVLLLAALLWLATPAVASAHAHLIWANPKPDSMIATAPTTGLFVFDESLNPALTRVRVTDADGRPVTADTGRLAAGHNGELWLLPLPRLTAGTYSVFWTSESATDGHVMSSFYTFRVAPSGGAVGAGTGTGAAAGAYGGEAGAGSGLGLGAAALTTALIHWVTLAAQALWLGALLVEFVVLAPARRAETHPAGRLARAATGRLWRLGRGALVVAALALIGEMLSLAVQGTGGDWARALDPATMGGILSSQNGHLVTARIVVLLLALTLTRIVRVPAPAPAAAPVAPTRRPAARSQALGIVARAPALALPRVGWTRGSTGLTALALLYMLLVALSGHAADVTPAWLSYSVDWLHLVCTAAWAGGIAALAWGVLPLRRALALETRAPAVLSLLDRFSPLAYGSVAVLTLSGVYNAVNHLDAPSMLVSSTYGQLLALKSALVGVLLLLSASHLYLLRPHIARLHGQRASTAARGHAPRPAEETTAGIHEGLATLAARLRLEGGVGAGILLATALMSQTLPAATTATSAASSTASTASTVSIPAAISGAATAGGLRAALTVAPPAIGTAAFTLRLREGTTTLRGDTAAVIVHLFPAAHPDARATLDPVGQGTQFTARGSLAAPGTWRTDVLVRTATTPDYRTLPFTFTVGPGAAFLTPGLNPDAVAITVAPGLLSAPNTFTIAGLRAPAVRLLSQSLDMLMGTIPYPARPLDGGRWQVRNAFAPMNGRWELTVQARRGGAWATVRSFIYQVPLNGPMRLLTPRIQAPQGPAATPRSAPVAETTPRRTGNLSTPFNVAFARTLPYTALVTEMGSNGVRALMGPLLRTGLQAHGVDVLDGTPYVYVTNFGAVPGTVSQLDLRTGRTVRTFAVGLGPAHVIFTLDHRRAFVTDFRSNDVFALDLASGAARRIAFPGDNCFEPHGLDISADGRTVYVACAGGAWIDTIDARTLRPGRAVITAPGPYGVAVDAPRHEVWVTNQTANSVTVLDEATLAVQATIPVGKGPALLVPTPDGRAVYVADQLGNTVSVIDAASRRVVATIPVAAQPHGPDVTADGKYVYVASIGGNAVTIIRVSDHRVVAVVPSAVGSNEVAIAH